MLRIKDHSLATMDNQIPSYWLKTYLMMLLLRSLYAS